MIETCVNINIDLHTQLTNTAKSLGLHRSRLVVLLLRKVIANKRRNPVMFERVQYQDKDPEKRWKKMHVCILPGEYEKALDLRKLFKFSVSGILAFAIVEYLPSILSKYEETGINENTDNSMGFYYFTSNFSPVEDFFSVFWTLPTNIQGKEPHPH